MRHFRKIKFTALFYTLNSITVISAKRHAKDNNTKKS